MVFLHLVYYLLFTTELFDISETGVRIISVDRTGNEQLRSKKYYCEVYNV